MKIFLVANNVCTFMGGEAIIAFRTLEELTARGLDVEVITSEGDEGELSKRFPLVKIHRIKSGPVWTFCYQALRRDFYLYILNFMSEVLFQWRVAKVLRQVKQREDVCVHYITPCSPFRVIFPVLKTTVIVGPLDGNVHMPPGMRSQETLGAAIKRIIYPAMTVFAGCFLKGLRAADAILASGGERTEKALRAMGCDSSKIVRTLYGGVNELIEKKKRIEHRGENLKFVYWGRFIDYKGVDLAIRSVYLTKQKIQLDIIGGGPEEKKLRKIVTELSLTDRVTFSPYMGQEALFDRIKEYRAFVFLSYREAFGLCVQESLMLGLPMIALNWGGPAGMLQDGCGVLIEPKSIQYVIEEAAKAMDFLALNGDAAETMSKTGRKNAEQKHRLKNVAGSWINLYGLKLAEKKHRDQ